MNFTLHTLNGIKLWLVLLLLSGAINVCRAALKTSGVSGIISQPGYKPNKCDK